MRTSPAAATPARAHGPLARTPVVLLALSLSCVAFLGVASRNFGRHWDEASITGAVQKSVATGLLLPNWYNYPSLTYDVALLTALPYVIADGFQHFDLNEPRLGSAELLRFLGSPDFLLGLRSVFFMLCTITGLAVFLVTRSLSGSAWGALFASLAVVTSWEFVYHARWVAPDGLVMLFTAFALWAQQRILDGEPERRRFWIVIASVMSGLATGAKYPGGILVLPLLLAIGLSRSGSDRRAVIREGAFALLAVFVVFALSTPGMLLEPAQFVHGVVGEMIHYQYGHGGHTVEPGWRHLTLLAIYFGTVLLSRNPVLAGLSAALALAGAVELARSRRRAAIWLLSLPVAFIASIMTQRVMLVRNVLLLLPVFAILAGVGLARAGEAAARRRPLRAVLVGAALAIVGFNLTVATRSAWSIVSPNPMTQKEALERRLSAAPKTLFFLSPACRALLDQAPPFHAENLAGSMGSADRFIFVSDEVSDWQQFAANVPGRYQTVWKKVDDVNWDYYPDWSGSPRMLEVSARALRTQ